MRGPVTCVFGALILFGCAGESSDKKASADTSEVTATTTATSSGLTSQTPTASGTSSTEEDCIPRDEAPAMPYLASEYAALCEPYVGVPPTVDCGDGVPIPIEVDGVEVFEDQARCDNADFKGTCVVGSRIGRVEGKTADGTPLPDVVWVYFCRSAGQRFLDLGIASVQMIGYNKVDGATCFFEGSEGDQASYLEFDEQGYLDGELPGPDSPDFDRAFVAPGDVQCVECHQNDPFLHDPWIDGARLPEDPSQPVLPQLSSPDSPYWVVAGADWDMRTHHIEGNACLSCHRSGMNTAELLEGGDIRVNTFMPPYAPGDLADDYAELTECFRNGPDATPGCEWVWPPGAYCEEEPAAPGGTETTTATGTPGTTSLGGDEECPEDFDPTEPCVGDEKCLLDGEWYFCWDGVWRTF